MATHPRTLASGVAMRYTIPAAKISSDQRLSTMLTSRLNTLTSHVATAIAEITASASRYVPQSNTGTAPDSDGRASVAGLDEHHLHVADRALRKPAFAIAEIEFPHPNERVVVAERADLGKVVEQVAPPLVQRPRVVSTDILEMKDAQIARACD